MKTTFSIKGSYLNILFLLLILKATVLYFFFNSEIGLSPDEAQYWTWSRYLDWGYYSKPPGIAWSIRLGTSIFGDNLFGIRVSSMLFGFLIPLQIYILCRKGELSAQASFWGALFFAFSPLGLIASTLAITDVGMVFFWICGLIILGFAFDQKKTPNYYLIGLCVLGSALFKWAAFLFWVPVLFGLPFFPLLRSWRILGGCLLSIFAFLPTYYWNAQHNWATFRHVISSIQGSPQAKIEASNLIYGNFFEFLGAQVGLLSPLTFILLVAAFTISMRNFKKIHSFILFCGFSSIVFLSGLLFFSIFIKVQGNWGDFLYPSAFVVLAWFVDTRERWRNLIKFGAFASSVLLSFFVIMISYTQTLNIFPGIVIPYKYNAFRHNIGWTQLKDMFKNIEYNEDEEFLFSSKYQMSSILSFYGPKQKRAYFFNIFSVRNNQFCYWPGMEEEQIGKNGLFVIVENTPHLQKHIENAPNYLEKLSPYFQKVDFLGSFPLIELQGQPCKSALIFKGILYNGASPEKVSIY